MRVHWSHWKQLSLFCSLFVVFLLAGCGGPQGTSPSPPVNQGHLIYTLSDKSLTALYSRTGVDAWHADTGGTYQEACASGGTVYTLSDKLSAFDAANGRLKWSQPLGGNTAPENTSNIVVDAQAVYLVSESIAFAFNPNNGSLLWRTELQPPASLAGAAPNGGLVPPTPTIIVQNGVLYTNGSNGTFAAALQTSNGQQLWSGAVPDNTTPHSLVPYFQPVSTLVFSQGELYGVTSTDLIAFNRQNGAIKWQTIVGALDSMAFVGDAVDVEVTRNVVGSPPSGAYQLSLASGTLRALRLPAGVVDFARGYKNGVLYLAGGPTGGDVLAVNLADGAIRWHFVGTGKIDFLDVLGGAVYALRSDGVTELLNASDGRTLWTQPGTSGQGKGAIADGDELYAPGDGLIMALDIHTGHILWSAQTNGNKSTPVSGGAPSVFLAGS